MGIDVSDSLLVGASYEELEDFFDKIMKLGETCENPYEVAMVYFETASPYYDSPLEEQFLGFLIPNFKAVDESWWDIVKETAHRFELLTGVKAQIRGGAHVW